jgi:hypothetical protein
MDQRIAGLDDGTGVKAISSARLLERAFRQPPDEAVVSRAKDRTDSPLCRARAPEEAQVLTQGVNRL